MKRVIAILVALAAVVGTFSLLGRATVQSVPSNQWAPTGDLTTARADAASTLMFDGRVLVSGGLDASGAATASVERYSPVGGAFLETPPMLAARANHTSTLLPDGTVLVAGGTGGTGALSSAEIYDPINNVWQSIAPMHVARSGHTATALYDGRIVIAGGDDAGVAINSIEIYDPWSQSFELVTTPMTAARTGHAAALTYDGLVVIAGGYDGANFLSSIDIVDPSFNTVASAPSLGTARAGLSATTLLDGKILLLGGLGAAGELASGEIYDPATNTITAPTNQMTTARQRHQAILLPHNNQVLIVGGSQGANAVPGAEVYVQWQGEGGTFYPANVPTNGDGSAREPGTARAWTTAAALSFNAGLTIRTGPNDGLMLLTAGSPSADASNPTASSELYGFATVTTDLADYAPGMNVTISGSGWLAGEPVSLVLVEKQTGDVHVLQPVTAGPTGHITSNEFTPNEGDVGVRFYLTATGAQSQAQTSFTDAPVLNSVSLTYGSTTISCTVSGSNCSGTLIVPANASITAAVNGTSPSNANANRWESNRWLISTTAPAPPFTTSMPNCADTAPDQSNSSATLNFSIAAPASSGTYGAAFVGYSNDTCSADPSALFRGTNAITVDATAPTVTINQAAGQVDPTTSSPINFTVVFSEVVTNFTTGDITITGTAGGTKVGTVTGSGTNYNVAVTGMTSGTVVASLAAGVATDAAGNPNSASTSTDNTVMFQTGTTTSIGAPTITYNANGSVTVSVSSTAGTPTGNVSLSVDGGTAVLKALSGGAATFGAADIPALTSPAAGDHSLSASYAAQGDFAASSNTGTLHVNQAATTTSITAPTITYNENGSVTVTVSSTAGTPSGNVSLSVDGGSAVLRALSGGSATFGAADIPALTSPAAGDHNLSASYAMQGNFAASSNTGTLHVNQAATTTSITAPTITYNANGSVTVTVSSAAGTPSGNVGLSVDGGSAVLKALSSGSATFGAADIPALTSPAAGDHSLSASYAAQGNFAGSSNTGTLHVNQAATTTSIAAPTITHNANGSVTVTVSSAAGTPSGNVGLSVDGGAPVLKALSSGLATFGAADIPALTSPAAGDHSLSASYAAQGNFDTSSAVGTLHVNQAATTASITAPTITYNANGSVTVTVSSTAGTPSGNVSLSVDGGSAAFKALSGGSATFGTADIPALTSPNAGNHSLNANYAAQGNFAASLASGTLTVNQATPTVSVTGGTFTYNGSPHAATGFAYGVAGVADVLSPPVTFSYEGTGSTTYGPTSSAPVNAGTYQVTASFAGNTNYTSASNTATITITAAATTTSVVSDLNPAPTGQLVTFTATVVSLGGVPTGTVNFFDDVTLIGNGTLVAGQATFSTSSLAVGTHPITAAYAGSPNFVGSGSSVLNQVVDTPPVSAADAYALFADTTLTVNAPGVLGNDIDADATPITAVLVDGPSNFASFALNADGSFTYQPSPGYTGPDSFTYKANDGTLDGNTVTVTLAVLAASASPVAENDAYHTPQDAPLSIAAADGVLNNDHSMTLPVGTVLVSGPAHASSFTLNADGSFDYTPASGFTGVDSFSYKANDGSTDSNLATVTIGIVAPAATPVANNDDYVTDQNGPLTVPAVGVLANDSGATGAALVLGPLYGTLAFNPDGSFTYTPNASFYGVDSFLYRATDGAGFSNLAMVSMRVKQTTTVAVTASAEPSVFGEGITFTATLTPTDSTGTVQFKIDGLDFGTPVTVTTGSATSGSISTLTVGSHSITAEYSGDATHTTGTGALSHEVNKAATTTSVVSSTNPSRFGESITFTATVAAVAPGAGTPTGTVTFKDSATTIGTGTLNGTGLATFSSSSLTVTTHAITAVYESDTNFNGSTSDLLNQIVEKGNTTTTLGSSVNPSKFGQNATFTATVAAVLPAGGTPTGTVTFKDGATTIGTGTLNGSGIATFSTSSLAVTTHAITAVYASDISFNGSTSNIVSQVVDKANTTTTITGDSPDPSSVGQPVTVQYAVAVQSPGAGIPAGNMTVTDGVASCTATVTAGQCTLAFSTPGPRSLTATYTGNENFNASTSSSVVHNVSYVFTGFSSPVDNAPVTNNANAGQAIPMKWKLTDANGVGISDSSSFGYPTPLSPFVGPGPTPGLTSYQVGCVSGVPSDSVEEYAPGESGLIYQGNGNWQINWKTPKAYGGQCRVVVITLRDGTTHMANFRFK